MIKYIYYIISVIVIIAITGSVSFLYRNFYLTLAGAQEVESLVGKVSLVTFDPKKIEIAAQRVLEKESNITKSSASDPFHF